MVKVLTVILSLTKIIRAEVKERLNTDRYIYAYDLLINYLMEETRNQIVDPEEEESSILDFKIFYLIIVLTSKNPYAQNYLFENFKFIEIIETNAIKCLQQLKSLEILKEKATESESRIIGKKVYKFMEMVYYLMINNEDKKEEIYISCNNFKQLKDYCHVHIYNILNETDLKSDVMNMIDKVFHSIS